MNFKRKPNWHSDINSGIIDPAERVKMWVLPVGCICQLNRVCGMNVIRNGSYDAANSYLGNVLYEAGISGNFIFSSTEVIPQNAPRWLTYWLSGDADKDDDKLKTITVSTLGQQPTKVLPFQVEVLQPIDMAAGDVFETIRQKSKNGSVSQFLVETKNDSYRMEPVRRISGIIIDVNDYGFVVKTTTGHVCQIDRLSKRVQHQLKHSQISCRDLMGTEVRIEYTMFTGGTRLCCYKSPIIFRSIALDEIISLEKAVPYESYQVFKPRETSRRRLLTTSRCRRGLVREENGSVDVVDTETGDVLVTFSGEPKSGEYAAQFSKDDEVFYRKFSSPSYTIDSIDPNTLVSVMAGPIFFATGLSLKNIGLCYESSL